MMSQRASSLGAVSVCIATKDRPEELRRCIASILTQTAVPSEIIVVDDGNLVENDYRRQVEPSARFKYFKKDVPSSAASKNMAKQLAENPLIFILDDDTVLEKDYVENILQVFQKDTEERIGIVGGVDLLKEGKKKSLFEKIFMRVFLLHRGKPLEILPWAFQTGFEGLGGEQEVAWISTGFSCFRKEVLKEFAFYNIQKGRVALEDVDFCWRVSRKYKIVANPKARLKHFHSPAGREAMYDTGFKHGYNRCWIFREHAEKSLKNVLSFTWAMTGHILGMLGKGRPEMAFGNIRGIISFLSNEYSVGSMRKSGGAPA